MTFSAWQKLAPAEAARKVHARVAGLAPALRSAALVSLRTEAELARDLASPRDPVPARPLGGVPYLLKDLFDVAGWPTQAGSTFLAQIRATPGDSAIVRLLRENGATFAGKTQMVEFASGLTGENPHFGDCPHPRFPDRLAGGSSSGSAALVAAGVVPLSIGTDTGGSIRVPAAFCGLHGFRLTPGDALVRDAFPLSPTMDTTGWFTVGAADMLSAIKALVGLPPPTGAPRGCFLPGRILVEGIDRAVDAACEEAAARFAPRIDPGTEAMLLESWRNAVDSYLTIGMSEAHAVHRDWLAPHREHYDPVIWQRFTDAGRFGAEKIAAARAKLAQVREDWAKFFARYDFLILPSAPCPAPTKAQSTVELRRSIIALTAPASLGGLPCLSVPVDLPSGLTAGLQIIAREPRSPVFAWALSAEAAP